MQINTRKKMIKNAKAGIVSNWDSVVRPNILDLNLTSLEGTAPDHVNLSPCASKQIKNIIGPTYYC